MSHITLNVWALISDEKIVTPEPNRLKLKSMVFPPFTANGPGSGSGSGSGFFELGVPPQPVVLYNAAQPSHPDPLKLLPFQTINIISTIPSGLSS